MVDVLPSFSIKVKNTFISGVFDAQSGLQGSRHQARARSLSGPPRSDYRAADALPSKEKVFSIKQHRVKKAEDDISQADNVKDVNKDVDDYRHDTDIVDPKEASEPEWEPPVNDSWEGWDNWNEWGQCVEYDGSLDCCYPHGLLPAPMGFWPPMMNMMQCPDAMGCWNAFEMGSVQSQPCQLMCPSLELAMRSLAAATSVHMPLPNKSDQSRQTSGRTAQQDGKQAAPKSRRKKDKDVGEKPGKTPSDDHNHADLDRPPGTFTDVVEKEKKPSTTGTETAAKAELASSNVGTDSHSEDEADAKKDKVVIRFCTSCGGRMQSSFKFCGFCGEAAPIW